MKYFAYILLTLLGLGSIIYIIPSFRQDALNVWYYSVCDTPVQYKIGSIDPKFGLNNNQVAQDVEDATQIWEKASGKNLFESSANAKLTINFIYDSRQALNSKIDQLNGQISQQGSSLKSDVAQFKTDSIAYQQKLKDFADTVDKYNSEGGAPPDVYDNLIKQQNELKSEADALNKRARDLNISADDYNANVSVLNTDVNQFNSAIAKKPEEGLYDGNDDTITIYFADKKDELTHTLAHEFGHSLGMDHVSGATSIMYPLTTNSLTPTSQDLSELNYVCRKQVRPWHWIYEGDLWFYDTVKSLGQRFS